MPTTQLLDQVPIWLVFVLFAAIALACYEAGFRLGRWWQEREPGEQEGPTGVIVGSILALLAFLGAGHTDDEGPYADNVRRGLHFLIASRAEDGWIAGPDPMCAIYEHAIAAIALSEAYGMTRSPRARDAAQRAVNVLQRARNPHLGWRYASNGENDTSVTAWCTLALYAAREAGLSRVYGGIHFPYGNVGGRELGECVGAKVVERVLPRAAT